MFVIQRLYGNVSIVPGAGFLSTLWSLVVSPGRDPIFLKQQRWSRIHETMYMTVYSREGPFLIIIYVLRRDTAFSISSLVFACLPLCCNW